MRSLEIHPPAPIAARAISGALSVVLLTGAVAATLRGDGAWWQLLAFGLGPDIALIVGIGSGLEKGQLHPRAVALYNVLHTYWGPCTLGLASFALAGSYLAGALAWAFHVSLDRALGYGMRTRDGFQRG